MVTVHEHLVEFQFYRPQAKKVCIAGSFNDWQVDQICMVRDADGYWRARLTLPAGEYRFRYYIDNQWFTDYAAFGLEIGPYGYDSIVRVDSLKPGWKLVPKQSKHRAAKVPQLIPASP